MRALFVCSVWPEPTSSAAGTRTVQLIQLLLSKGWEVLVVSPCQDNSFRLRLNEYGAKTKQIPVNSELFDLFLREISPEIIFFDRFMVEEQFGWRARAVLPDAIRILDTIDLHLLRRSRMDKVSRGDLSMQVSIEDLRSDDCLRELAAIYRSDVTLVVSDFEKHLLEKVADVPKQLCELLPFYCEPLESTLRFEERENFAFIGNFNHQPNRDAFNILVDGLWQKISESCKASGPSVELHVYGSYIPDSLPKARLREQRILILGHAEDSKATLSKYRVNLAPLRFGAGIKGKILDGFAAGTPFVGTKIASEGIAIKSKSGGLIAKDIDEIPTLAASLYTDKRRWRRCQSQGYSLLRSRFSKGTIASNFEKILAKALSDRDNIRKQNLVGGILWHQYYRSTEYFSRWIELKNQGLNRDSEGSYEKGIVK